MFKIRMGQPEMLAFWNELRDKVERGQADTEEDKLFRRMKKALQLLAANPRHPGLQSHKIEALSKKFGQDVWESYLQNHAPGAGRLFWTYGPESDSITILAVEPHPNDRGAYRRVKLSTLGNDPT